MQPSWMKPRRFLEKIDCTTTFPDPSFDIGRTMWDCSRIMYPHPPIQCPLFQAQDSLISKPIQHLQDSQLVPRKTHHCVRRWFPTWKTSVMIVANHLPNRTEITSVQTRKKSSRIMSRLYFYQCCSQLTPFHARLQIIEHIDTKNRKFRKSCKKDRGS